MSILSSLEYQQSILYDKSLYFNGRQQFITLHKALQNNDKKDYYYLNLHYINELGKAEKQGYIYFYIDFDKKESLFVGMYVKPIYRNLGLSQLLLSSWIQLCLHNDIDFLKTIKKQRKPFIIYLLKGFHFEIRDPEIYSTDSRVISICQKMDSLKYLHFRSEQEKKHFQNSQIIYEDNYHILDEIDENTTVLDQVILRKSLSALDNNQTYSKAQERYNQYKNK